MELEISSMENQEHIYKLEKRQMEAELKMKEAVIAAQADQLSELRKDFVMQVKKSQENEEKFKSMLDGLSPKVVN
jgi:hypothetical protein